MVSKLSRVSPNKTPAPKLDEQQEEILQRLAELGGKLQGEDDVVFEGTKIVLPANMNLSSARDFIDRKITEEEEETNFSREFKVRPYDGARAAFSAMKKAFGLVRQEAIWHWWGKEPPEMREIPTGVRTTEQIPWGRMAVPMLPGASIYFDERVDREWGPLFKMTVIGPRKYRHHIQGFFRVVTEELQANSLYRGKAFDGKGLPDFVDLTAVEPGKVIYSHHVRNQLDANVWAIIRHTDTVRKLGSPLKRAILLHGPYGTGKTLAAGITAQIATEFGWTFIQCRSGRDNLEDVMRTARLYQPCVAFMEDVDTIAGGDQDGITRVLDLFDGIQAKGTSIILILTTNHAERIHRGMMRPGRLDAVIEIGELDTDGIMQMIFATVPMDKLDPDLGLDSSRQQIGAAMEGFLPAYVREAIDRAVRYAVSRTEGSLKFTLDTSDFVGAAEGLRPQLQMMKDATEGQPKPKIDGVVQAIVEDIVGRTDLVLPNGHTARLTVKEPAVFEAKNGQ